MELLFDVRGGDFSLLRRSRSASSRLENKLAVDFLSRGMRRGEGCCAGGSEGRELVPCSRVPNYKGKGKQRRVFPPVRGEF